MKSTLPQRKKLPHEIPSWVPDGERYFVTINSKPRGEDHLCRNGRAEILIQSIGIYEDLNRWYVWLMVVMPDHLHMIACFNRERGIRQTIKAWKGYHAKQLGIVWQPDFFEHRLRNDAEFSEKASYVRNNPVRGELVGRPEDWPYTWQRSKIGRGVPAESLD